MHIIAAEILPNVMFFAGLLLVAGFLLRWTRWRQRRPRSDPFAEAKSSARGERPTMPPATLGPWEVQMHELARDLSAQLDTKILIVDQILRRAEEQTARLESAINRAAQVLDATVNTGTPAAPDNPLPGSRPRQEAHEDGRRR